MLLSHEKVVTTQFNANHCICYMIGFKVQKQPFADVLQNMFFLYSEIFINFHRKTPVSESVFNKAADVKT